MSKEDKIQIRQFKSGSSDFWCNYAHYHLNENNELIWCSGEQDKEELREAVLSFIRRNKKVYVPRETSIFEQEQEEYIIISYGKYSGKPLNEISVIDRKYARWLYESSAQKEVKEQLKKLLKIK